MTALTVLVTVVERAALGREEGGRLAIFLGCWEGGGGGGGGWVGGGLVDGWVVRICLDWIGLDWIGLDWIGLMGLDWMEFRKSELGWGFCRKIGGDGEVKLRVQVGDGLCLIFLGGSYVCICLLPESRFFVRRLEALLCCLFVAEMGHRFVFRTHPVRDDELGSRE